MKYLLVIANYPNFKQRLFDEYISPKNVAYAERHGFEYIVHKDTANPMRGNVTWMKYSLVRDMLAAGELVDGDTITHLDADMVIVKPQHEYTTNKSYSYAIDNGNTHCKGSYTLNVNDWTRDLIDCILSEDLWQKCLNEQHWQDFREQAAYYTLCGIKPHSWESFLDMPDYGWYSAPTENAYYSLSDLHQHIEVRGPEWNTTLLEEEPTNPVLQQYNIVKSRQEDTIIRHFAGGQNWNMEYLLA